jgi:hypothetical protein
VEARLAVRHDVPLVDNRAVKQRVGQRALPELSALVPCMLLYFPAENAAVSAVVLLCSGGPVRSTLSGPHGAPGTWVQGDNREIRNPAIPISRVDQP